MLKNNNLLMPAAIVILAGGQSRRMGSAKALLTLPNGEPLLDYHIDSAKAFNCPILIADNGQNLFNKDIDKEKSDNVNIKQISDYKLKGAQAQNQGGALVAILGAMQTLKGLPDDGWLLIISCDSLISAAMLWEKLRNEVALADDNNQSDIICLNGDRKILPLLGAYRLSLADELKMYLDSGERRVMPFIIPKAATVDAPKSWQALANFNTQAEFASACQAFHHLKAFYHLKNREF